MTSSAIHIGMTVNGADLCSATFEVIDPATEEVWAHAPDCTAAELDSAFTAADSAFADWSSDADLRRQGLRAMATIFGTYEDELAELLTREQGKTLAEARVEVQSGAQWCSYFADVDFPVSEVVEDGVALAVHHALGVIAAITPWNYPIALAMWKLAPALRAGNTVVLKPSPYTPITTLRLGELLRGVLPDGVVNVVTGGDDLGAAMTRHPATAKVSFTGSVEAGKAVARSAADDLKRITLELGGNDAAIVLPDADPATVAPGLFWAAFYNNGQVCGAVKRAYVHDSIHDDMAAALSEIANTIQVGNGLDPNSQLGAISNATQFERVRMLLTSALAQGALVSAGGEPVGERGYFHRPTVLTETRAGMAIVDEEQFGPVLPIRRYRDVDDVVREVNSSKYGLGGSVWSADVDTAATVARRLQTGTTWINAHAVGGPHLPFGGVKWSGIGVENGMAGLKSFTRQQILHGVGTR